MSDWYPAGLDTKLKHQCCVESDNILSGQPEKQHMFLKWIKKIEKLQLFYDFVTITIISSSSVAWVRKLNRPQMAPGP